MNGGASSVERLARVPGFVDLHVHFRDPGFPEKEDIFSGGRAAAAGGFTTVCMMPNTAPAIDSVETLLLVDGRGRDAASARINVFAAAAMTAGQLGGRLVDFSRLDAAETRCRELTGHGVCGITEDGKSLLDDALMERVCAEAARLDLPIMDHAEDKSLVPAGASMNEGAVSRKLGLAGIPSEAEESIVRRDIALSKRTGARFHIQHVSAAGSVALIRAAKREGAGITCETAPHYFALTDFEAERQGAMAKMNPPLRTEADRMAVVEGLCDGTIDCIATDHAPHEAAVKELPMEKAAFGIIGLETCFAVSYTILVRGGYMEMGDLARLMSKRPAEIIGLPAREEEDFVLLDLDAAYTIDRSTFVSRGRNTPFHGMNVYGRVAATVCGGRVCYTAPGWEK
ncbi:MAG: dihydroorotase [Clostridiales Family XIII bacterium]|jgi:dihydroorotase|nr:dihydroorotase [Clostridiales Family XIII bacterium]